MLNAENYIYLSESARNIKCAYKEEPRTKGNILADIWLENKAKTIDLWGVDGWCEEFVNTFLKRVWEAEGSLKDVNDIQWYFNCETCNMGLPQNHIWIRNYLSDKKIVLPDHNWTLESLAESSWPPDYSCEDLNAC